ncbi:MAG: thiamine pyrophosphate-dependent enzyme, partial [Caldilineaceae bacterium]|nr:thiamine pyrophosphate-dependent enzyme [Caldilineaceae bacterium]
MAALTSKQKLEIFYWMVLARTFDEGMVSLWKQGRGLGGTFSQRGHEAVSVGSAYALAPEDIIAPMHRDIGAYFLRGLTPRRVFGNLLGKVTGVSGGRDANIHGMG